MITPLPKHHGQRGVLAAFVVLVASIVVVLYTHPKRLGAGFEARHRVVQPAAAVPAPAPVKTIERSTGKITATGVVSLDEKHSAHVFAPVRAWITKVEGKRVGRTVRAGETLATLYSVDVYLAELDLVAQVQQFTTQDLLSNARRRLQRWSMPKPLIDRVEKTGQAYGTLPLIAPRTGTLVKATALPGMFVEPTELFTITDPTRVWVFADFTEADAARIRVGTPARLTISGMKPLKANVAYIYRLVEDGMKKARFELVTAKPLQPGTIVDVEIE